MIQALSPIFLVDDVNEAIKFYQTNFDLTVTQTHPNSENYDFAILQNENIEIMLQSRDNVNRELHLTFTNKTLQNNFILYLEVDNIEFYFHKIKDQVKIISPIKKTNYRTKEFTFTDKNGITITLGEVQQYND